MRYDQLTPAQQEQVRRLYKDSNLVMPNLHRIKVQIGLTGIVQSVTTPWLFPLEKHGFVQVER